MRSKATKPLTLYVHEIKWLMCGPPLKYPNQMQLGFVTHSFEYSVLVSAKTNVDILIQKKTKLA